MIRNETPHSFNVSKNVHGHLVAYENLREFSQGGPEVGTISIDGKPIEGFEFGGPCLGDEFKLFAPAFVKIFLGFGFQLAVINTKSGKVKLTGVARDLIYLDKTESKGVYFFDNLEKTRRCFFDLED